MFAARTGLSGFRLPAGCGLGFAARTGLREGFVCWPVAGRGSLRELAMSRFRLLAGCGQGFAARIGYEQVSFACRLRQFQFRRCRRPTRGRQSPRPLDPGLRPASPPLRGPFASSGFLTDRRDAPSLARSRLFATSLSLVLKSLICSALQIASLTPRCYYFFLCLVLRRCDE